MQTGFNIQDITFIKENAPDLMDLIVDLCKVNVSEIHMLIHSTENVDNKYIKELSDDKKKEMIPFYNSIMKLFIDYELYEDCAKTLDIIESLEKIQMD